LTVEEEFELRKIELLATICDFEQQIERVREMTDMMAEATYRELRDRLTEDYPTIKNRMKEILHARKHGKNTKADELERRLEEDRHDYDKISQLKAIIAVRTGRLVSYSYSSTIHVTKSTFSQKGAKQ
jgi:hypothetical protein